eukprot:GEMP01012598.1.p1 GENE.GEMP01012598.1~~GEMP01012598.1.p1  ORF type:complete len:692 (+),score=81.41 GEMP01012598.1:351-2426(+)
MATHSAIALTKEYSIHTIASLMRRYGVFVSVGALVGVNAIFSLSWKTIVIRSATKKLNLEKPGPDERRSQADLSALWRMLRVSIGRKQGMLFLIYTFLLFFRSWVSVKIAMTLGETGSVVVQRQMAQFVLVCRKFALLASASTLVNACLRKVDHKVVDSIRTRLTTRIQRSYLKKCRYYHLARQRKPFVADQRIVRDVEEWSHKIVHLFAHTFKPLVDVILSARQLFTVLGPASPLLIYGYFAFAAAVVGFKSPPFARIVADEQRLEGEFHQLHSRIISHSEEIAFMRGEEKELSLLEGALQRTIRFRSLVSLVNFFQNILDNWLVKYSSTLVGIVVSSIPLMLREDLSMAEIASLQRTCDILMRNSATATADIILTYKKVLLILGFTGRIEDIILALATQEDEEESTSGAKEENKLAATRSHVAANSSFYGCSLTMEDAWATNSIPPSFDWNSYHIRFQDVTVQAPDGRLLIKSLNLYVQKGDHTLVTGPNGAGKTSLFRVVAGLWNPVRGNLYMAAHCKTFYLPQKPYMVSGNIRDQVWYPSQAVVSVDNDLKISKTLADVGLDALSLKLDTQGDWNTLLSGGEKQKLAFARLLFHEPQFAVLDEATAALSADSQEHLYRLVKRSSITFFSIAHRTEVRKFHIKELCITGDGDGSWVLHTIRGDPGAIVKRVPPLFATRRTFLNVSIDE